MAFPIPWTPDETAIAEAAYQQHGGEKAAVLAALAERIDRVPGALLNWYERRRAADLAEMREAAYAADGPERYAPEAAPARCPRCGGAWGTTEDDMDLVCLNCGHQVLIAWSHHGPVGWRKWAAARRAGHFYRQLEGGALLHSMPATRQGVR